MKKGIMILILISLYFALSAQTLSFGSFLNHNKLSFFNNNRISMHHSFGFSSSFSSAGKANFISDYTNHLNYRISSKLNLKMNLHFVNYGMATYQNNFSNMSYTNSKKINVIPEFILDYSPSNNFHIKIMYNRGMNTFYPHNNFINDFR